SKKGRRLDFEYLTGGHSGESLMQNCVPPISRRYNTDHLKHWSLSSGPSADRRSSSRTTGQPPVEIQCTGVTPHLGGYDWHL
ncbi:hypothetical protein HAX54_015236, partial [Datura stramonium]|nr:hypothetical protein [Datura stramonium]